MLRFTLHERKRIILFALIMMITLSSVHAFQFEPLTQEFSVSGAGSTKTYTITNDTDETIAVTISALTRDQDLHGFEVNKDASAYFSIQPSKVLIKPQTAQIIRVSYRGPKKVTRELSFRIKAEQIPYSQGKAGNSTSMFNFLYVYNASAYVSPSKVNEKVIITKVTETDEEMLALTVANSGTVHQILDEAVVTIHDAEGHSVVVSGEDALPGIYSTNILAGKAWTKNIPWPEGLKKGSSYSAGITYNYSASR